MRVKEEENSSTWARKEKNFFNREWFSGMGIKFGPILFPWFSIIHIFSMIFAWI